MYELYNPTILKIETIKLEKRLDDDLTYLVDALPEYSTFDFHMEPVAHPAGAPIPVNPIKVGHLCNISAETQTPMCRRSGIRENVNFPFPSTYLFIVSNIKAFCWVATW